MILPRSFFVYLVAVAFVLYGLIALWAFGVLVLPWWAYTGVYLLGLVPCLYALAQCRALLPDKRAALEFCFFYFHYVLMALVVYLQLMIIKDAQTIVRRAAGKANEDHGNPS